MLKALKTQEPARSIKRHSKGKRFFDPSVISSWGSTRNNHFIIHETSKGWCFAMFYRFNKDASFEIIGASYKPFKTKGDCIKAMKKIMDGFGGIFSTDHVFAYDRFLNKISLKIEYDVQKLL